MSGRSSLRKVCQLIIYPLQYLLITFAEWADEDQELPGGNTHLWEAGWDDDDANNEFVKQLKKAQASKSSEKDLATNKPVEKNSKEPDQGKGAKTGTKLSPIAEAPEPDLADHEDLDGDGNTQTPKLPP